MFSGIHGRTRNLELMVMFVLLALSIAAACVYHLVFSDYASQRYILWPAICYAYLAVPVTLYSGFYCMMSRCFARRAIELHVGDTTRKFLWALSRVALAIYVLVLVLAMLAGDASWAQKAFEVIVVTPRAIVAMLMGVVAAATAKSAAPTG